MEKEIDALRTMLWPMRAMAVRRSVTFLPLRLMRRGIRDAQQARRQRRLRSHHAHNLFNPRIGIGQDPPDLQRYFRKRRQVNVAAGQFLGEAAYEIERDVRWRLHRT